jgi:nucleoside-diphosphate-sugar epimerase
MPFATPDWKALHGDAFGDVPVVVTGGAGFIGSHLVQALCDLGARVIIVDDFTSGRAENVDPRAALLQASILDRSALGEAMAGARFVFHLAALVSVPASVNDPVRYHEVNVNGTLSVLEAAKAAGVRRVMFSASSSAYGDTDELPKHEKMPPLSKSPYAANKVASEHLIRAYANTFPVDAVSLRYFNIFGPRQVANSPYSGVIAKFAAVLLAGKHPPITGDGSATRDFTYVANAVHANLLAARHDHRLNGDVFNVATGERLSIRHLAETMARLIGRPDLTPEFLPARPGDVMDSQGDLTKVRTTLGYDVIVPFEPGLASTLAWYQGLK